MMNMLQNAKAVKADIARLTTAQKNGALHAMADALVAATDAILAANELARVPRAGLRLRLRA